MLQNKNGESIGLSYPNTALYVSPLEIYEEEINLLWNIPYDKVVNEMGLGLFVNSINSKSLSVSSVDIGFSVSSTTPI